MRKIGLLLAVLIIAVSCRKYKDYSQKPELEPLQQGLKTSMAVGYCASIAVSAFQGRELPSNVNYNKSLGLIYITIDQNHPLPFNSNIGDIVIAGIWHDNGGIISILFADIDLLNYKTKFYGIETVPIIDNAAMGKGLTAILTKQDIIMGVGSDTILNLNYMLTMDFNHEMERANSTQPSDVFIAVKQNVWFINIDRDANDVYKDNITINGGGQIVEVESNSGGILYHGMINTKLNYAYCPNNPISGTAISQNFKAGGEPSVDLGNSVLSFHNSCDGRAHVDFASGKYITYNNKYISLDLK